MNKGSIVTPDLAPVLEGITRDAVVTLAGEAGYDVAVAPLSRDQLYGADEVFVGGTASEVIALREIDFRTIGEGKSGPVTPHTSSCLPCGYPRSAQTVGRMAGVRTDE